MVFQKRLKHALALLFFLSTYLNLAFSKDASPLFQYADIYSGASFLFSASDLFDGQIKSEKNKAVSGVHAAFRGLDVKAYSRIPFTESFAEDVQSGFSVDIGEFLREEAPVEFFYGDLKFSKSIALLKNPSLSLTSSAVKPETGRQTGLGISLPSSSLSNSSERTNRGTESSKSSAVRFTPGNFTFECVCFDNPRFLFSCAYTFKYGRRSLIKTSVSGGRFYIEGKQAESWFGNSKIFSSGWYDGAVFEIILSLPALKNQFSVGIHRNPFGNFRSWFRNENRMIFGPFLLKTDLFATDNYIFSDEKEGFYAADGKLKKTIAQIRINPQIRHNFSSDSLQLCAGIATTAEIERQNLMPVEQNSNFAASTAVEITSKRSALEFNTRVDGLQNIIPCEISHENFKNSQKHKTIYAINLKGSHVFSKWKAAAKISFLRTQNDSTSKDVQKYFLYVYFPKKFISSIAAGTVVTDQTRQKKADTEINLTMRKNDGKIRFKGKLGLVFRQRIS
ncbi:hypothetical protein HRQ91_03385 [Treponema parvum]|uniref:Uncharacterized protein n=1 Tax=Treponema parvum TaxID=138851 RepID=A0A975IE50_9SPIR|nr:hypothetical protein [Treponema parvum]QTQ13576.1 hypothetical protein HRQ91_03385 [Treponema parvum]